MDLAWFEASLLALGAYWLCAALGRIGSRHA